MSAEHRICWVLVCDACRTELHDPDEEFVPHFDTVDAATDHALSQGWQLDTDGHTYCHRCVAIATCLDRRARLHPVDALRLPGLATRITPCGAADCSATANAPAATPPSPPPSPPFRRPTNHHAFGR